MQAADEFRILVAGGLFIGEFEANEAMQQDNYHALYEILQIASSKCDFVTILGDLFLLNSPSNQSLTNVLSIFRQQVLGDREIKFSVRKFDPNFANSKKKP